MYGYKVNFDLKTYNLFLFNRTLTCSFDKLWYKIYNRLGSNHCSFGEKYFKTLTLVYHFRRLKAPLEVLTQSLPAIKWITSLDKIGPERFDEFSL